MTTLPVNHVVYGRGTSTSIVTQGVRKTHTTFLQGTEMVEEFDATTELLKVRRVRHRSDLGAQGPWKYEVGDPIQTFNPSKDLIAESSANPVFSRHDSPTSFIFRVRNLPYPASTYQITVTGACITVRTSNRKYYKQITIPELTAAAAFQHEEKQARPSPPRVTELSAEHMTWEHAHNTLLIHYRKPQWLQQHEAGERMARKQLPSGVKEAQGEADAAAAGDCKQQ